MRQIQEVPTPQPMRDDEMRALVCHKHGWPKDLAVARIARPAVPPDGVLVRVQATSVNPVDFFSISAASYLGRRLARRPGAEVAIPGADFAGTVEAVGSEVTEFRPGDEVFGGYRQTFADYICVPASAAIVHRTSGVTAEQAAALPVAAVTALQAVRDHGRVQGGQRVLINGASGGVGTFAVQIAKHFDAEVTAVCSPPNVDRVRSLGADVVIDYTRDDFTKGDQRYDVMLDIAGNHSWSECTRVLTPNGTFVSVGGSSHTVREGGKTLTHFAVLRLASLASRRRWVLFIAKLTKPDLSLLQEMIESGRLTPVIDRRYDLSEAAAAMEYLAEGHARGKVVVTM